METKVAVVFYSLYGHIHKLADAVKAGLEAGFQDTGKKFKIDIYQVAETLPEDVLKKMYAPAKSDVPIITPAILEEYDAFMFGVPTRYGNFPAQWKTFWDSTGQIWVKGGYTGKYAGMFVSTGSHGGGQESTFLSALSTYAHHGIIFVPLGYSHAFPQLTDVTQVHGGSPWGAGTFAGADGSRTPTALELELAGIQGKAFAQTISKVNFRDA